MKCTQQCHLVSFPKVRVMKQWFRHFNDHKEFHNEGTLHLFSLMSLYSYANFRSNTRKIGGSTYMESGFVNSVPSPGFSGSIRSSRLMN